MNNNKEILKATLFVAGEGVEKSVIKERLELNEKQFNSLVDELKQDLSGDSGIILIEYKNKLQLCIHWKNFATARNVAASTLK